VTSEVKRRKRALSRVGDKTSKQEVLLAKPLKPSKKFAAEGVLEIEISNNPHIDRIILSIDRSQYSVVICMASTYLL
jgi:hypothetical protein